MSSRSKSAQDVFDAWAADHHADGMEEHHGPRVRLAFEHVVDSGGNYLEVGVGNGYGVRHMATGPYSEGRCYGLDLSAGMADKARQRTRDLANVEIAHADFLSWRPSDPSTRFSLIFSMEVFYYFPEIQLGMDKAATLLEPGGELMVLVNYFGEHEASHAWPEQLDTPMQLWSAAEYRAGFERAGLRDVEQRLLRESEPESGTTDPGTLFTRGIR